MDKLRRALSGQDELDEEQGNILTQMSDSSTLNWSSRIKWFAITFGVGFLFTLLGVFFLMLASLTLFAIFYTLGNILAIASTCFLIGPMKQMQKMFSSTRIIATVIMIAAFIMTLVAAFVIKKNLLAFLMVLLQFLAMTWYSLSYIPYARDAVKKCFGSCMDV